MTGDFSGRYIELDLNESGVLYQQGRVFLDQDGNAETRIFGNHPIQPPAAKA